MKYRVSLIPDSEKTMNFKVWSDEGKEEVIFHFSKQLLSVWGRPLPAKLREVMVAYIKKNGWSKTPVEISLANSLKNLNQQIKHLTPVKAG